VGVFTFTADPPNDYLGAGDVFGGATYTSANIGRFIPGHFEVAIAPDPPAFADAQASYTYLGQPFNWSTVPQFTVTAMNGASTPVATENYEGSFFKLDNELEYSYLDVTVPSAASPLTPASSSQTLPDTSDCGGMFTVTFVEASGFNYTRPSPDNPVSSFSPNVTLTIPADELTDSDGVCYKTTGSCLPFLSSGIIGANIRHGRSLLEPVYGPETSPLTMSATVHWYNSTAWAQNVDDDYTSFSYSHLASGLTVSISPVSPLTMTDGLATMILTPTGTTHAGTVTVTGDFPSWLEPDPSAVAVFGIARGNDRIINWQEKIR
jgi:MSHA biogenesis protein MshQ